MDTRLVVAAQAGDINALYALLKEDPNVLEIIGDIPFVDTPLHVAAGAGHTHFAIEVLGLKPSFGRKLNPDGFSPLHLAVQKGHATTAKRLVEVDSELVRVQGKERFTPLHYVAAKYEVNLLAEFLVACPGSIEDLTNKRESAVHLAAKHCNIRALQVLVGWLKRNNQEQLLNWKDEEGNTVLHIVAQYAPPREVDTGLEMAAFTNQPQAYPPAEEGNTLSHIAAFTNQQQTPTLHEEANTVLQIVPSAYNQPQACALSLCLKPLHTFLSFF